MKNSDLLLKAKKDGLNSLSVYELRRLANMAWKEDVFTLNGLVKYVKNNSDQHLAMLLEKCHIKKDVVTVAWLLKNCDPKQLKKTTKNEKGEIITTNEKRQFFSLWFVSGTIQRFAASIQAAAQSSGVTKVKQPETVTIIEDVNKEVEQTTKRVNANRRQRQAAKNAKQKAA